MDNQPLVSVPVITYNSSKYVIETLESIKSQTYQNLELIVSDDCSTDNTVELCRNWIEKNKDRFVRTELLTVGENTGISANCNRAESACNGEWIKMIAGDDLLVPKCVDICIEYVTGHLDVIYLFGRRNAFGSDSDTCKHINESFDYSFFNLTIEDQLHRLIYDANCVPAVTAFYNVKRLEKIGVRYDERIPLLEDWPRWINLLKAGVKFHFVNDVVVDYRIGGISTVSNINSNFYRSGKLFYYLYIYPERIKKNPEKEICRLVDEEVEMYEYTRKIEEQLSHIENSYSYRFGKKIIRPLSKIKKYFCALLNVG